MSTRKKISWSLIAFLILVLGVELLGSVSTKQGILHWYPTVIKPSWTPPPWLFGPVWTILYLMMAIAGWRVWKSKKTAIRKKALLFFFVQLFLNGIWSFLFFGLHNLLAGLIDLSLLWISIVCTTALFWKIDTIAGGLFLPYLLWSSFALALNAAIYILNR